MLNSVPNTHNKLKKKFSAQIYYITENSINVNIKVIKTSLTKYLRSKHGIGYENKL